MATRKGKDKGEDNGESEGDRNGDGYRAKALEFDDFAERVTRERDTLLPTVWLAGTDNEGRTFGSRLGKLPLDDVDTLDDRIAEQWPGPRTVALRVKKADGSWAFTGKLNLGPSARSTAPTTTDPILAALLAQNEKMQLRLDELTRAQQPQPAPRLNEQVGALDSIVSMVAKLIPQNVAAAPAQGGMSLADAKEFFELGKKSSSSVAPNVVLALIDKFGEAGGEVLKSTAALVAAKVVAISDANERAEAEANAKKIEAPTDSA